MQEIRDLGGQSFLVGGAVRDFLLNQKIQKDLDVEVFGMNEVGFTFAVPYDKFALGLTAKYLQGLFYFGIDPDSSVANMITSD